MSILRYSLFFLPIHHYTHERYYQRHDEYIEKHKKKYKKFWGESFDQLNDETKERFKENWWWPPWKFNDIVGYLEIGTDGGDCLTADIFLKRKYLPKGHHNKRIGQTKKTNEILYFRGMERFRVRGRGNDAYLQALDKLLSTAKKIIKKRNGTFELWLPPFDFSCINFVEAIRQAEIRDTP